MKNKFLNRFAKVNNLSIDNSKLCIKAEIADIIVDWKHKNGEDTLPDSTDLVWADDFLPYVCDNGFFWIDGEKHRVDLVYKESTHFDVIF